jgi:hypothetical protein
LGSGYSEKRKEGGRRESKDEAVLLPIRFYQVLIDTYKGGFEALFIPIFAI